MHQAIARRFSSATTSGSLRSSSFAQQLTEQVVVAIPIAPPVQAYDEAVRALERVERVCRPSRLEHRIAERTRHTLEHRRVLEEGRFRGREAREKLDAEVVGHELVVAVEALISPRACRPRLHRQRCEVQTRGPPFRPLGQVGQLARIERDSCSSQQQRGLLLVKPEVRDADLLHMPVRPPAGKRQCRLLPASNRDLRAGRNVLDEFRDHVKTRPIVDEVQIVEHEHQGTLECCQSGPDTRDAFRPGGCPSAGQRVEHLRRDRLDSVDRGCDVAQEHDGVAVSRVEHDPRKRARVSLGPTREKGCLAVPDRRNHTRETARPRC